MRQRASSLCSGFRLSTLAVAVSTSACNAAPPHLCEAGEEPVFSCPIQAGKQIALCLSKPDPKRVGFGDLKFRLGLVQASEGRQANVEMEFPKASRSRKSSNLDFFEYQEAAKPGSVVRSVSFQLGKSDPNGLTYAIYSGFLPEDSEPPRRVAGMQIRREGHASANISCERIAVDQLTKLAPLLPRVGESSKPK